MESSYKIPPTNFNVSHSHNGTTMVNLLDSGTQNVYTKINNSISWRESNKDYQIELDISFNIKTGSIVSLLFGNARWGLQSLTGLLQGNGHITIITNGDNYIIKWNGETIGQPISMGDNYGFMFAFYHQSELTFKNLIIYEI